MMRKRAFWLSVAFLCLTASVSSAQGIKIGRAAVKITPPVGSPMGNSYGTTPAKGVTSDIYAKALVFEKNGVKQVSSPAT